MLKLEEAVVFGFEPAIRGMRNPKNSWEKSDGQFLGSSICYDEANKRWEDQGYEIKIGPNDLQLMKSLASGGPVHAKYRRMIVVYVDITAPLYWWKEFDTYKVGTVANSCSTMHKIHAKEFVLEDFSCEHLQTVYNDNPMDALFINNTRWGADDVLNITIKVLNYYRNRFLETNEKAYWWQMIQLLPSSYNQRRTVMLNYEVLVNIHKYRRDHKLDEWHTLCDWIETLPYANELIL